MYALDYKAGKLIEIKKLLLLLQVEISLSKKPFI